MMKKKFRDKRTGEVVTQFMIHEIRFYEEVKEGELTTNNK